MDLTQVDNLKSQIIDGVAVLGFDHGSIHDEKEILLTLESLSRYVGSKDGLRILFDMSNVDYMSSAGLGLLVGLLKAARKMNGEFKLCCLQDAIHELFELMQFDRIFEIFPSRENPLASFQQLQA